MTSADMFSSSSTADDVLLEQIQRTAFEYFIRNINPHNGLVSDSTRDGAPCSIAVVGFALSAYAVGVERGWMTRSEAVQRTLVTLRFFMHSDQSGDAGATGFKGCYFHFLDMQLGTRVWNCELSLIDTAFLIAGVLTAAAYFTAQTHDEAELRQLAQALFQRVDWRWAQHARGTVVHGWKPECGFLSYGWDGYSEAILLYVLGLGSPTHALTEASFRAWTMSYQWENLYGYDFLYAGPLFIHQYSHAWVDFRGIQDAFMREKKCDYFENSRRASYVQREYACRNPRSFVGYSANCWGLSAGDGPSTSAQSVAGRHQEFYGYAARGVPYGPDDGTICGSAMLSSLPFAPEIVLPSLRHFVDGGLASVEPHIYASGFNRTISEAAPSENAPCGWISPGAFGLDQGMIVLMIENYRSGLLWRLMRDIPCIKSGLKRAGFAGGWLSHGRRSHGT